LRYTEPITGNGQPAPKPGTKGQTSWSTSELIRTIEELQTLEQLIREAEAEAESLKDSIKAVMVEKGTEELEAGTHIIRYTTVLTQRFDSTSFKKKYEELYRAFTKQTTSKRFTIS